MIALITQPWCSPDDSAGAGPCALVSAVCGLLGVSFNKATMFGAADVPAIKRWAELLMVAGSLITLALATWLFPEPSTS